MKSVFILVERLINEPIALYPILGAFSSLEKAKAVVERCNYKNVYVYEEFIDCTLEPMYHKITEEIDPDEKL